MALAMMTREVCLSKSGASDDFITKRILPSSSASTAKGAPAQPTSTCPLMVAVKVAAALPVGVGLSATWKCFCKAKSPTWLAELLLGYATVLSFRACGRVIDGRAAKYQ